MRFKRRVSIEKGQLDVAPLIDVVFNLLIFFMLTSSFVFQPGIKVNLPRALTSEVVQAENLILIINKDNKVYVEDRVLTDEELKSRLNLAARRSQSILIKADRLAFLGEVVRIWDLCRKENIEKINIATTQEGE